MNSFVRSKAVHSGNFGKLMKNVLKFLEAIGIAVTGVGLVAGVMRNSMGDEYLYASIGISLFFIARYTETRMFPE